MFIEIGNVSSSEGATSSTFRSSGARVTIAKLAINIPRLRRWEEFASKIWKRAHPGAPASQPRQ